MTSLTCWLVNVDNYRRTGVVDELESIAALNPDVIALVEALGNPQPDLDGYVHIADDSNDSRRNIAAYVRADLNPTHVRWHDCRIGWRRTKYAGQHEPRSFVSFRVGGRTRVIVAHQPPPGASRRAKVEHLARLAAVVNRTPTWPTIVLWDSNGAAKTLARITRASVYGWRVDNALARRVTDATFRYAETWPRVNARGSVRFGGDHRHVWRGTFDVPARFLTRTPKEKAA
jgi:hypothetical protein